MLKDGEGRPTSFLLVEDDWFVCRTLAHKLRTLFPHVTVRETAAVDEAAALIAANPVDVCFVDLFLGEESGIDRFRSSMVRTAFIVLTSHSVRELAARHCRPAPSTTWSRATSPISSWKSRWPSRSTAAIASLPPTSWQWPTR